MLFTKNVSLHSLHLPGYRLPYVPNLIFTAVSRHRTIMNLCMQRPGLAQDVFVAPSAAVIGDVSLGNKVSVWYGCVLKGKCGHSYCFHV